MLYGYLIFYLSRAFKILKDFGVLHGLLQKISCACNLPVLDEELGNVDPDMVVLQFLEQKRLLGCLFSHQFGVHEVRLDLRLLDFIQV